MIVFSIRDDLAKQSGALALAENIDHMRRLVFDNYSANTSSAPFKYPDEFSVHVLAEFEPRSGELKVIDPVVVSMREVLSTRPQSDVPHVLNPNETH